LPNKTNLARAGGGDVAFVRSMRLEKFFEPVGVAGRALQIESGRHVATQC
jgi:hypothetical protein